MPSSNFKVLRQSGRFVDKTLFLKHVHHEHCENNVSLIFRPHRFGKTIIAEMTDCFYRLELDEHGNEVPQAERINPSFFQDTKIWNDVGEMRHMGNYPLIHLRFNKIRLAHFEDGLREVMKAAYDEYGLHLPLPDSEINIEESLERLILILNERYQKRVVVIIDEFDTPLNCLLLQYRNSMEEYAKLKKFAQMYYHLIETVVRLFEQVEFALLLGNLRLTYFPLIFPGHIFFCENLVSTLTEPRRFCEDLFGFTDAEIIDMCSPKTIESHTLNVMRQWYGGLTPTTNRISDFGLFTPHSVTSCIESGFVMDNFADLSKYPTFIAKSHYTDAIIKFLETLLKFDRSTFVTICHFLNPKPIQVAVEYYESEAMTNFVETLFQHGLISPNCCARHLSITNEECKIIIWKKLRLASLVKKFDLNRSNCPKRGLVDSISNYKWSPKFTAHLEKYVLKILAEI